ncbi:MAG: tyrosine-type recombinase/integrase [Rhodospirillales bacterium]|nr:tyrosine-type recombinase/integrase [Rhodospirillales bacterium]
MLDQSHAFKPTTLADVLERVGADPALSATRRRDLSSAVRRIANLLNRSPNQVPARITELRPALSAIHPAQAGISEKTWQNIKANFLAALRHAGVNQSPAALVRELSPDWRALHSSLPDKRMKNGLSRFIRFCSVTRVSPSAIGDDTVTAFMTHVREQTFVAKPKDAHRRTTRLWNEATHTVPGWPPQRLTVPDHRQPRTTLPLSAFPSSFVADVEAHLDWMAGTDPFCANPPPNACKPRTISQRRKHIELAASAYVARGRDIDDLGSLADLIVPNRFKEVLRFYLEKNDGVPTQFLRDLAKTLILIARYWVRVDTDHLSRLKDLKRRLGSGRPGLTDKNRAFLRQFDDFRNRHLLLDLPSRLFAKAGRAPTGDVRAAVTAQISLAIEILLMAPIRMKNLIALRIGEHLVRPGGSRGLYHLVLHETETKNTEPIEFELPRHLTDMIDLYLSRFRTRLCDDASPWLFPNIMGDQKAQATLSQQIVQTIRNRTGITITPHQFRHLAALIFLDAEPGNFEAVRRVLGHRNMKTTTNFYAGLQTRSAARLYDDIILNERRKLHEMPVTRRRRR